MDVCLRVLKESNKSRFDSYSVRNSVLIISHITFRDCRVHSFCDNLSRNSCIRAIIPCSPNMVTLRVCSKVKTSRKLVGFTNKVGKNSRYFSDVLIN